MTRNSHQNNLPENFIQKLGALKQLLRLSPSEAQSMRERLAAYADMHEVTRAIPSPFVPFSFSLSISHSRSFVAGLLILILIVGTGSTVTYAAGNSLPGQPLYPVEVNVAEPIEGAVIAATSGTTGSATWQNTLAERRITEATTLAAENDLASSTQTYLLSQAAIHVAQSEDDTAKLEAAGNTNAADEVRTDLEARLAAHAELLALIAPRLAAAGDATTTSQVATLLSAVSQDQASILFNPDSGEAVSMSTTTSTVSSSSSSTTTEATTTIMVAVSTSSTASSSDTFHTEEAQFFAEHMNILSLLPALKAASTTASTSPSIYKNYRHSHDAHDGDSTSSTTTSVTVTGGTENSDSPASNNSEATTTIQIQL